MPEWYWRLNKLARASRYLNCSALDLVGDSNREIVRMALAAMDAEAEAAEAIAKIKQQKDRVTGG